jgi:predicted alpha/beta superfamily hydrolase
MYSVLVLLFCCAVISANAQTGSNAVPPQVQIAGTQVLKMNSSITGQEYELYVSLPREYDDTSKTFPVIYLLDAQWDFTLAYAIYGEQYYDGFVPGTIIVGITWGGNNPDYDKRRAFDLTPYPAGRPDSYGNAEKFLSFIKKEAIPFVEKKFRAKKEGRVLMGSSFGGLFTLYALLKETDVFGRYIMASPAWEWDKKSLLTDIAKFSNVRLGKPVRVFMTVGQYENVQAFEELAKTISDLKISGLELKTLVVTGAGHSGTKAEGYTRGFQYVFKRPCVSLEDNILKRFTGEYAIDPQVSVKVAAENGRLAMYLPGNLRIELCAESEKEFYATGFYLKIKPLEEKEGKITGLRIERYEGEMSAKKIR